jgi:hypothetical protein
MKQLKNKYPEPRLMVAARGDRSWWGELERWGRGISITYSDSF